MKHALLAAIAAVALLFAAPAFAQDAAPAKECRTIEEGKKAHPEAKITKFNAEQIAAFKAAILKRSDTFAPIPDAVADIYWAFAVNAPEIVIFIGFDKDGCMVGSLQMTIPVAVQLLGGNMPKHTDKNAPWDGTV